MLRAFINYNVKLCNVFDKYLALEYQQYGHLNFDSIVIDKYLKKGATVYDIGSGKHPCLSYENKTKYEIKYVGIDIDKQQLESAPCGIYDRTICADIASFKGDNNADLVISRALLEHVKDVTAAVLAISTIIKPGGIAVIFVPSRFAVYAIINKYLPEKIKKKILFSLFPQWVSTCGFKSYYNKCTPREMADLAKNNKFTVKEIGLYYRSDYFTFFFPLYILWRLWILIFKTINSEKAAETFTIVLQK